MLLICGCLIQPSFAGEGDSPLEAIYLPYDTEVSATIGSEYTSDYYMVVVPAKGRLVVSLYDIALPIIYDELHIYLYRSTQNSIGTAYMTYYNYVAQSENDSMLDDVIDIPDLARGIYFIKVWPDRSGTWDRADYKIKAEFTLFPPVVTDDIGNEKKHAIPIVNQLPTICTLSDSNDIDYFECHLPDYSNLTLELTNVAGSNVYVELYTASDILVLPTAIDQSLYYEKLSPGQYFIKIFGDGPAEYVFTATQWFADASVVKDDVANDLAHAMPLLPGNPSVFCLQPYDTDCDIFSIYQPEDGVVTVDVYNIFLWGSSDDLKVRILDEYGKPIVESDNSRGIPEHIDMFLPRGQYFVAVYSEGYDKGAVYTIRVETSGDDVEDTFNQAMQIHSTPYDGSTYGHPYVGIIDYPGDTDFFQVILNDKGFIYLKVDCMLYSNIDVQLFDANHNLLKACTNSGTQVEVIYVDGLEAGLYFIKVYSPDSEIAQYSLMPKTDTETSIINDDIGDDTSRAFPLVPYRRVNGYLWDDSTDDYFKFILESVNELVRVRVDNLNLWNGRDINLYVYDAFGYLIEKSENTAPMDEIVELEDLGPGVYYAKIDPQGTLYSDNATQYSITLETDTAPLPSAELYVSSDIQGIPGEIIYVPIVLDNSQPDEITSMSVGVQFDPSILEPIGVSKTGLTIDQWEAQIRYSMSMNTISVSMDSFSTIESGELLNLIFMIKSSASTGDTSTLTILTSILNGAIVPGTDGLVTVIDTIP